MNDDQDLDRAFRALRESTDGSSASAARTRQQILARVKERGRQRQRRLLLALPLAAAFIVSAAWGAVTGRLPPWLAPIIGGDPQPRSTAGVGGRGPSEAPGAVPSASAEPTVEIVPPASKVSSELHRGPLGARPVAAPSASAIAAREEGLYEAAHRAHFVDGDSGLALRRWDTYLAEYPTGRFALEARYNRAISLIRLGRRAEGRAALLPFAGTEAGGYRQQEARELLDALAAGEGGR